MLNTIFFKENEIKEEKNIKKVADIIKNNGTVIIPTETVYGLAANGLEEKAVAKIFAAKMRPADNPLILHISNFEMLKDIAEIIPENAIKLADKFWPGPLTMIFKKKPHIPLITTGGLESVAVRMPKNEIALSIINASKIPLAAPSANLSGKPSPTNFNHCCDDMNGRVDCIIDGGECGYGLESTVIDMVSNPPVLLRPGAITPSEIENIIGKIQISNGVFSKLKDNEKAISPGLKYKHYSPNAKVFIIKGDFEQYLNYINSLKEENVFGLVFDGEGEKMSIPYLEYGHQNNSLEQAQNLFKQLRELDKVGAKIVYARNPVNEGIGLAVYNRLIRAAAFEIIDLEG